MDEKHRGLKRKARTQLTKSGFRKARLGSMGSRLLDRIRALEANENRTWHKIVNSLNYTSTESVFQTSYMLDMKQGDSTSDREGDAIDIGRMSIRYEIVSQTAMLDTNAYTTRVIIGQWKVCDGGAPVTGDLLQANDVLSPLSTKKGKNWRILHDET